MTAISVYRFYSVAHDLSDQQRHLERHSKSRKGTGRLPAQKLKAMLEDMRSDRDAWRDQMQRLALPSPQPSLSWWRWLRTSGG